MYLHKQLISAGLIATTLFTMVSPALALNETSAVKESSFTYNDEIINYQYKEENGIITYVKVGNDVVERIDNHIYLNGDEVAIINSHPITLNEDTDEASTLNNIQPCTGWVWSEDGDTSNYSVPGTAQIHDITLTKTIAATTISAMTAVVIALLPIPGVAQGVANAIITYATGIYVAYQSSKHIYCLEVVRKHIYNPSFQKMVECTFFYDGDLGDEVPGSNKTLFGWWG